MDLQWNPRLNTTLDNPGIDISARATLPVKSVFDGYVSTITFIAGYGTTVIIDHNNSYYTVFTHLENLLISENMNVKEGKILAMYQMIILFILKFGVIIKN